MKLFHNLEFIGDIEFVELVAFTMWGRLTLAPAGEKFKEMFAFLVDSDNSHTEPPFPESELWGWFIEDEAGVRHEIACPGVHDNFTTIGWRLLGGLANSNFKSDKGLL